ncbi:MAG: cysteine desulfurase [Coriobacteriales bacterium]|jgi:cysteine desulfurase|nr:cysteine desulfurase [Coriobacteriales bacterium]
MTARVYLDYAATAPLRPEVLEAMRPWLSGLAGNANTLYQEGKRARQALDEARATVARCIGASPTEVVFTSGGTESDNALIIGIAHAIRTQKGRERGGNHVVSTVFEHHAVLEPVQALKREGYEVTLVKPTRTGFIEPDAFAAALRPDTLLASVMMAQNEIGTVQPIAELARLAHANGAAGAAGAGAGASGAGAGAGAAGVSTFFHTDAVQALGKLPLSVRELGVDAASFSAHKLGGPQGVGAFYLKRQTPFAATQLGGGQENKRRSGTQNIAGAVGFAKALELAEAEREHEAARLTALRDHLATALLALDARITLTIAQSDAHSLNTHLPGLLSFLVAGYESETLILKLDSAGFAVSGGSACSTGSLEPSHVLTALGLPRDSAHSVLRVSLGHETTQAHITAFLATLATILHS